MSPIRTAQWAQRTQYEHADGSKASSKHATKRLQGATGGSTNMRDSSSVVYCFRKRHMVALATANRAETCIISLYERDVLHARISYSIIMCLQLTDCPASCEVQFAVIGWQCSSWIHSAGGLQMPHNMHYPATAVSHSFQIWLPSWHILCHLEPAGPARTSGYELLCRIHMLA